MEKPLTARKRQALEMRSRIQNVALDLFDRDGFENVAVEQIAQAAGCSVGNIYHYFKSKDELIIQVTSNAAADASRREMAVSQMVSCLRAACRLRLPLPTGAGFFGWAGTAAGGTARRASSRTWRYCMKPIG